MGKAVQVQSTRVRRRQGFRPALELLEDRLAPSLTPLQVSANQRYLVDGNNTPFLITGDAAWSLILATTQAEADQYLTARANQGFNLVMVNLIDHMFGPNAPANMAGAYPFLNVSTGQHRAFIDPPNESYFAYADWVINDAAQKGMYVLLDPSYLGFGGGSEGFYQDMVTAGTTAMRQWGEYVGNRYQSFTNIIWLEGGDYNPPANGLALVNEVALGIQEFSSNIQTAHTARGSSAEDIWGAYPWMTLNSTYTSTLTYDRSLVDYNRTSVSPSFLVEDYYENEHSITQQQGRAEKYWNLLSGSTGALMGNDPIWAFDYNIDFATVGPWQNWLNSQMATDMSRLDSLFSTRAWYNLVPDQSHTVVTAGFGTYGQANYVTAARTGDGTLVMAYVPSSSTLTVNMSKLSGTVTARWFDPTNGNYTTVAGSPFANTGSRTFATPGNNSKGDGDWVLVLEAAPPTIPAAPTNLTATPGDSQVVLSWTGSSGAASYNIYRSTSTGAETLVQSGVTGTTFTNTGLTNGTIYFYKIAAVNAAGTSPLSNEASGTPQAAAPAAPTNLSAMAGDSQVSLSWTASSGATSYNIYRSTTSGSETLMQSGITGTAFTNTGLANGTTYFFKVAAVNANGTSGLSSEVSATPAAFAAHINFTTSTGEPVSGYVVDSGLAFANRGNGLTYGWDTNNSSNARDRDLANSPDELHDSLNQLQRPNDPNAYWEIAVSNGTYSVHLAAGDPGYFDSVYKLNVEGVLAINGTPTAGQYWFENTITVTVTDGRLTISNAAGSSNNKINFIDVVASSLTPPAAPTNLIASAGDTQVSLGWTASSGAASYNIYRSTSSGAETLLQSGVNGTTFTNTGLTNGTTYFYKVAAVNTGGTSALSSEASATPQVGIPAAPTNLTASAGDTQVSLSWTASSGATTYKIYRSTSSGTETLLQSSVSGTTFTNTGLTNGTAYYYKVAAVNSGGTSALSSEASATPQVAIPAAPTNLTASAGDTQVSLSWTASSGATTYNIYRSTSSGAETLLQSGVSSTTFTNTGLTNGSTYYYKVAAVNAGGTSALSSEASATPQVAIPAAPTSLAAVRGDSQVSLSWAASSGATSYKIYRSTSSGTETLLQSGVTGTTFTNTGLTNGTTYYYKVAAVNASGTSAMSSEASATPQVAIPAAPTNLTATAGNAQVSLSWAASSGATSYNIYRSTSSGAETLVQSGVAGTTFTDPALANGTTYYYKVNAVNAGGTSAPSNEASATPSAATFTGARINFTTSIGDSVAGYLADTGAVFGDRGNGLSYGWNIDSTANARDRDMSNSPDELHDSFIHMQKPENANAFWEIAVPNGTYTVRLGAGDPGYFDSVYKINVEGVLAIDGTPTSTQQWFDNTVTVTVTDGRLTISNAAGSVNNKLDFVEITAVP